MPEGHTLFRAAAEQGALLRGKVVRASSPQGRFTEGAAILHGRVVEDVEAYGKHLLYRFGDDVTLHVHLGLYGVFTVFTEGAVPPPTPGTRLQLETDAATIRLAGATAVELFDEAQVDALLGRLGPDPLKPDYDAERVWANLRRRSIPIAAALMDQSVIAGIGNVFRAEALFAHRINPHKPANRLDRPTFDALSDTVVAMMGDGVRRGVIITVPDDGYGDETGFVSAPQAARHFVYRRTGLPCLVCGTLVVSFPMAGRTVYACPRCQKVRRPPRRRAG